jgi:hypothetical protein
MASGLKYIGSQAKNLGESALDFGKYFGNSFLNIIDSSKGTASWLTGAVRGITDTSTNIATRAVGQTLGVGAWFLSNPVTKPLLAVGVVFGIGAFVKRMFKRRSEYKEHGNMTPEQRIAYLNTRTQQMHGYADALETGQIPFNKNYEAFQFADNPRAQTGHVARIRGNGLQQPQFPTFTG